MRPQKIDEVVAGLERIFGRPLTDEETDGIVVWEKCRGLAHFLEGFPHEWQLLKEMLRAYLDDFKSQWDTSSRTSPNDVGDLKVIHAQIYGATRVVESFIQDAENAPELAKQVPPAVIEGMLRLRERPQEQAVQM